MAKLLSKEAMKSMRENLGVERDHLKSGEFICPEGTDFVSDDIDDVMGHMLGAHGSEAFTKEAEERVIEYSSDFRIQAEQDDGRQDTTGNAKDMPKTAMKDSSGDELGQRVTAEPTESTKTFYGMDSDDNSDSGESVNDKEKGLLASFFGWLRSIF